ncbi:MAG: hypothetical protein ABIW79_06900 [Gemmatimonas sp.]
MIRTANSLSWAGRLSAIVLSAALAGCGADYQASKEEAAGSSAAAVAKTDTAYGAAALVATSAWCLQHGCVAEPLIPMDSGVVNHPFSLPNAQQAAVEVQTMHSLLVGAGLMLWKAGHTEGPETQSSLVSFVRGIVGDCEAGVKHVEARYNATATGVLTTPAASCGPWEVRTGRLPAGFYVSVDRRK